MWFVGFFLFMSLFGFSFLLLLDISENFLLFDIKESFFYVWLVE